MAELDPIGGGLTLLVDALKFYKLRREWAVRVLFLLCLLVNLPPVLLPLGKGLQAFFSTPFGTVETLLLQTRALVLQFDGSDALWLSATLIAPVLSMLIAVFYATLYVDELKGLVGGRPVLRTLRRLPRLALLYILVEILVMAGGMLFFLPSVILVFAIALAPLYVTDGGRGVVESLLESARRTNRYKMRIAFLDLTLVMGMNLPTTLVALPFMAGDTTGAATGVISAFFSALSWLMLGRLHGKLYHLLVCQADDVIPSTEKPA
jgi:hypothetical protein